MHMHHTRPSRIWPFAFHDAAERANRRGDYQDAIDLFVQAAQCAITPAGAQVLIEKARAAEKNLAATVQ